MSGDVDLADALFSGLPIGAGQAAACSWCNGDLRPNDRVEVHAYLLETDVHIGGVRCPDCTRDEIRYPTLGATEWVATGTIAASMTGHGRSQLVLAGADVVDTSGPNEGSEP